MAGTHEQSQVVWCVVMEPELAGTTAWQEPLVQEVLPLLKRRLFEEPSAAAFTWQSRLFTVKAERVSGTWHPSAEVRLVYGRPGRASHRNPPTSTGPTRPAGLLRPLLWASVLGLGLIATAGRSIRWPASGAAPAHRATVLAGTTEFVKPPAKPQPPAPARDTLTRPPATSPPHGRPIVRHRQQKDPGPRHPVRQVRTPKNPLRLAHPHPSLRTRPARAVSARRRGVITDQRAEAEGRHRRITAVHRAHRWTVCAPLASSWIAAQHRWWPRGTPLRQVGTRPLPPQRREPGEVIWIEERVCPPRW
jgi:hypothetical protein